MKLIFHRGRFKRVGNGKAGIGTYAVPGNVLDSGLRSLIQYGVSVVQGFAC